MIALTAANRLGSRKRWICSYILQHLSALSNRVMYLIPIHTEVISNLLMVAVAASEEKNLLFSVFLRVQNVIAFTAKFHGTHLGNDEKGVAKLLDVPSSLLLGAPEIGRAHV